MIVIGLKPMKNQILTKANGVLCFMHDNDNNPIAIWKLELSFEKTNLSSVAEFLYGLNLLLEIFHSHSHGQIA